MFADRLQEVAQRGVLDPQDRDELFYFAFLNAVRDTPKMQNFIERAHLKNRNLKLSDLLALSQEYLNRSPTALRRTVAVNVCRPSKPSGKLIRTEDVDEEDEVLVESVKSVKAQQDTPRSSVATTASTATSSSTEATAPSIQEIEEHIHNRLNYLNKQMDWVKKKVQDIRSPRGTSEPRQPEASASSRSEGEGGRRGSQDSRQQQRGGGYRSNNRSYVRSAAPEPAPSE